MYLSLAFGNTEYSISRTGPELGFRPVPTYHNTVGLVLSPLISLSQAKQLLNDVGHQISQHVCNSTGPKYYHERAGDGCLS